jgi:hypothetical protein
MPCYNTVLVVAPMRYLYKVTESQPPKSSVLPSFQTLRASTSKSLGFDYNAQSTATTQRGATFDGNPYLKTTPCHIIDFDTPLYNHTQHHSTKNTLMHCLKGLLEAP